MSNPITKTFGAHTQPANNNFVSNSYANQFCDVNVAGKPVRTSIVFLKDQNG